MVATKKCLLLAGGDLGYFQVARFILYDKNEESFSSVLQLRHVDATPFNSHALIIMGVASVVINNERE